MAAVHQREESTLYTLILAASALLSLALFVILLLVAASVSPLYAALLMVAGLGAAGCVVIFGVPGAICVAAVVSSFLLMVRIDEGLAIPLQEPIKLKATYWVAMFLLFSLGAVTLLASGSRRKYSLGKLHGWPLVLFCLFTLFVIPVNLIFEPRLPTRALLGELLALLSIALPPVFALLIPRAPLSKWHTRLCLRAIVGMGGLAGLIMSLFGLLPGDVMSALGWSSGTVGTVDLVRGRLPLGHPNTVAAIMLLLVPSTVILGLGDRQIWWRAFYAGCGLFMFCGTLFALSRGALLCMMITVSLSLLYLWTTWRGWRRALGTLGILSVGVLLVGLALFLFMRLDFSRFWSRGYFEEASVERRLDSMKTALLIFAEHPLQGISPDSFYNRLELRPDWDPPLLDPISPVFTYQGHISAETPHNMYLMGLAEFGLIGAGLFLWVLLRALGPIFKAWLKVPMSLSERRAFVAYGIGVFAFFLMGVFEALLFTSLRANVVFWIFLGLHLRFVQLLRLEQPDEDPSATPQALD